MTEVWKSQAKKFCEVCRCWFADNKASVDFHEKGDRHKAALARAIRETGRKKEKEARAAADLNSTLALMESSAIASMKNSKPTGSSSSFFDPRNFKDVRSMAWELGKRQMGPSFSGAQQEEEEDEPEAKIPKTHDMNAYDARFGGKIWVEAEAEYGRKYYFHINTGETTWVKPDIFFTGEEYDAMVNGRDPDEVAQQDEPAQKKKKRKPRHKHEMEKKPEIDLNSLNLPKLEPFKKNVALFGETEVPSQPAELPKVQHFPSAETRTYSKVNRWQSTEETVKKEISEETEGSIAAISTEPVQVIAVDGAVVKIQPDAPGADLIQKISTVQEAPLLGKWQKVIRTENEVCNESPLTARYREAELQEQQEKEEREKQEEKNEIKIEFTEKIAAVSTKKVKGPIEFKKRTGPKNIRKRVE